MNTKNIIKFLIDDYNYNHNTTLSLQEEETLANYTNFLIHAILEIDHPTSFKEFKDSILIILSEVMRKTTENNLFITKYLRTSLASITGTASHYAKYVKYNQYRIWVPEICLVMIENTEIKFEIVREMFNDHV